MSELQKAVANMLVKATQAAETAGAFVVEQLPDVARQYVTFKLVEALLWAALLALGLLVLLGILLKLRKLNQVGELGNSDFGGLCIVILLVAVGISVGLVEYLRDAALAYFAPKVLLIQWAADLVK